MQIDDSETFGKGKDATSRLLYAHSLSLAVDRLPQLKRGVIYDLGGGNGLSRKHFPNDDVVTIDSSPAMKPDIVADIRDHDVPDNASLVLLRFVLHYLTDVDVGRLLDRIKALVLLIQFTNDDIEAKTMQTAGIEDHRYFRTWDETTTLLGGGFERLYRIEYTVTPEFYMARTGRTGMSKHDETLGAWFRPKCTK